MLTEKEENILLDLLVDSELCICDALIGSYELNEDGGDYCSRNCHYECPQKECYIAYARWKAGEKWIKYEERQPPENKRIRFKMEYICGIVFECEGTVYYKNGECYRKECFNGGEIEEMFWRSKCLEWYEVK